MTAAAPSPMGALSGAESPPFRLPGSHFAAALGFLLLGALGVIWAGDDLAAGAYLSNRVSGTTHLFTLGWITTSIMGALYQFLPVALEREIRWPRLAQCTLALHVPGLAAFVWGLLTQHPTTAVVGATVLATGILLFLGNLAATLTSAARRDLTWWALALAAGYLFLTVLLGGALAANVRWPFMGAARLTALGTHLHVALVGWVLLVMVGVGQRLLPMFLLSHGASERPGRWAVGLLATGTALLFALHHAPWAWTRRAPALLILAGAVAFLLQARAFYRTRKRPHVDAGMGTVAAALVVLAGSAVLGGVLSLVGFAPHPKLATAYVTALVLGISIFVAAHYYKIVPFLVWFHRFGPVAGRQPVPKVADLYAPGWAAGAGALLTSGAVLLAVGVAAGAPTAVHAGGWAFITGVVVEICQLVLVSRKGPA